MNSKMKVLRGIKNFNQKVLNQHTVIKRIHIGPGFQHTKQYSTKRNVQL